MAQPFLLRRTSHSITIGASTFTAWPAVGVDYGNVGAETDPPTVAYINEVDDTPEGPVVMALPLSAEGVPEPQAGGLQPFYRHFISVQAKRKWTL